MKDSVPSNLPTLVERLRDPIWGVATPDDAIEAANEIERLRNRLFRIGKELALLDQDSRSAVKWVVTNCMAMADGLIDGERDVPETGVKP